jgi:hypothetical protein
LTVFLGSGNFYLVRLELDPGNARLRIPDVTKFITAKEPVFRIVRLRYSKRPG